MDRVKGRSAGNLVEHLSHQQIRSTQFTFLRTAIVSGRLQQKATAKGEDYSGYYLLPMSGLIEVVFDAW